MAYLLCYTREPIDEIYYDPRLAYSMHLALSEDGKKWQALNHNSGVLFPKATENEDGSLNPKSLHMPRIFAKADGTYGVVAKRAGGDGEEEEPESYVLWTTRDFVRYEEIDLISREEAEQLVTQNTAGQSAVPATEELQKQIEGAVPENVLEISEQVENRLKKKLLTPFHVGTQFPEKVVASNEEDLRKVKAAALYSDGTTDEKKVDWDLSGVNFKIPGTYQITGKLHAQHYDFPIAYNRADPCIAYWEGKYYFIATNDADGNHTLYIREADSIPELVNAEEHLLLDSVTYPGIGGLLWAPEFHEIEGRLYIFHACTPEPFFEEESHIMVLKEGGNPIKREDWSAPKRVVRKDGSDICEAGKEITLDMTCFPWEGDYYVIWSQRQFLPKDLGAWLYIAKLNPEEPWKLLTDPVVLLKPDYGWSNNHTFVVEGPFALMRDDKLFVTFSGAAVDTSYVVGLLQIEKGKDLLNPANWRQGNYPLLTSRSMEGEFGTGHNAYVTDEDGTIWNTYHARPGVDGDRSSGIRRVHFDVDGEPVLDLTEELDVRAPFDRVETTLVVDSILVK